MEVVQKPETLDSMRGVNFTPTPPEADSETGGYTLTPIGIENPVNSMGVHTYPLPLDSERPTEDRGVKFTPTPLEAVPDPWDRLYDRAQAATPRICNSIFGDCAEPKYCGKLGRCRWSRASSGDTSDITQKTTNGKYPQPLEEGT